MTADPTGHQRQGDEARIAERIGTIVELMEHQFWALGAESQRSALRVILEANHELLNDRKAMREERDAHAARAEELQRGLEFFVRYWWEQHKPDERDLEMARLRISQTDVQAILASLSAAHRPDDDAAPPSAGGAGDE